MARYVVVAPVTTVFTNYLSPGRSHVRGQVLDLSPAEVTAIGAGNLRAVTPTGARDQLGESFGASNATP